MVSLKSLLSHIRSLVMVRKYSPARGSVSVAQRSNIRYGFTCSLFQMFSHSWTWPVDVEIAPVGEILEQLHLAEINRRRKTDQILHRPVGEDRTIEQRQHAPKTIADHCDVGFAGILLHAADAIRNEVEDVILHPQTFLFRLRRGPVQHVDVVAALQQKLDEALPGHHVEDIAAIGGR